ncbi:MAG TPA: CAP domain-containing protein [Candidatus Sulfotelmatobacter sp.]|nr:CAP domain-containing protein [Candidatus Sulfotelmatobacter sp.]
MKRLLQHFFIPHESNKHRARVLHHDSLLIVITLLFSALLVFQGMQRQYPAVLGDATASITVQDLLRYTNIQRETNGLAPLNLNPELTQAAQMKAKDMFAKNYWAHVSPDGTTPWVFIKNSGYEYLYAGENLARGFNTSSDVVTAWMNSPEHRANMLSPNYTDIGFSVQSGTLTGTSTTLVVQEFGSPYQSDVTTNTNSVPKILAGTKSASPSGNINIGQPSALAGQAAVANAPIFDANLLKRNIAFVILGFFLVILAIDAIIVERKNIVRIFSHNVDHMLFLLFILLAGIIIGRGVIL